MRTKLLFAAAAISMASLATQEVYAQTEMPEALKVYDFEDPNAEGITLGKEGNNKKPSYLKSLTTNVMQFTISGEGYGNRSYAHITNPFKGNELTNGATISIWARRKSILGGSDNAIWSFGGNANFCLMADRFKVDSNVQQTGFSDLSVMHMITVTFDASKTYTLYFDGEQRLSGMITDDILANIKNTENFCLGDIEGYGTFTGSVDDLTFYDKALNIEEIAALYDNQKKNWNDFNVAAANMQPGETLGVTYLLRNSSCCIIKNDNFNSLNGSYAWSGSEGSYANTVLSYDHWWSTTYDGGFLEYNSTIPKNRDVIYQDVEGLIPGSYKVKANVGARAEVKIPEQTTCEKGLILFANNGNSPITSMRLDEVEATGMVMSDGKLRVGVHANEENTNVWIGLANVQLEYLGAVTAAFDETSPNNTPEAGIYNTVEVKRNLKEGVWNTLCLPFDMNEEQTNQNFAEVMVLTGSVLNEENGNITLTFEPATTLEAGKPYIVKVNENIETLTVKDAIIKTGLQPIETDYAVMTGSYTPTTITGDDTFFISDNMFYVAGEQTLKMKGFRAYLKSQGTTAHINRMLISIDGETTAIEDVLDNVADRVAQTVNVYNLSGVKVKANVQDTDALEGLPKGVYIVNGKKVIK